MLIGQELGPAQIKGEMDKVLMEIIARLMGTRKFSKLADGSALKSSIFDRRLRLTKALPDLLV